MSNDPSQANGIDCADCIHSRKGSQYPPVFLVCICPAVLAVTGGPRSCRDKARTPWGLCKPEGHLFSPRVIKEVAKEAVKT